jgi:hypothetical protein
MADIDNPTHLSRTGGTYTEVSTDDTVQHGIDDNPSGDAEKGATLGGLGGAAVGLAAGAAAGPVGAIIGAVIGGVAGAAASGAAVAAVDRVDNDNTVTGLGHGATADPLYDNTADRTYTTTGTTATTYTTPGVATGAVVDTYGDVDTNAGVNRMQTLGENVPSIKTGGVANDGTPDTRGIGEKTVDAVTGDVIDDKTGRVVNHP